MIQFYVHGVYLVAHFEEKKKQQQNNFILREGMAIQELKSDAVLAEHPTNPTRSHRVEIAFPK